MPSPGFKARTVQPVGKSLYLPRCSGSILRGILPENQMHRSLWHLSVAEIMILMQFLCGQRKHEAKLQINILCRKVPVIGGNILPPASTSFIPNRCRRWGSIFSQLRTVTPYDAVIFKMNSVRTSDLRLIYSAIGSDGCVMINKIRLLMNLKSVAHGMP